ncbi:ABC transporter [Nocardiopsis terrae]|uniref:Xylobiose transport system permease protein n=1 Tax=Nocardiopsis terrae TaxID=372655 RepID=A0ABR9HDT0_9ACTN|nr:sugar ABC transporter permease [Nocardiopsis terrae]MBE1457169.1 xylobiose transport system permease protein [Nocardiopsis terrae]GHC90993.1 ABC transporter [Nocardiopsis terrae]
MRASATERPGFVWVAPALLFFGLFGLGPVAVVAYLSFTSWSGIGSPEWTGLDNWSALAGDAQVGGGLRITLTLTALCWVTQTPLALAFGVWAAGHQRVRAVVSAVFFLPLLLSTAAIALVWKALLDPSFGVPAQVRDAFGLTHSNVLGSSSLALYAIVFILLWQFLPFHMLLYQAAARQVPQSLYEAAELDGASGPQRFLRITVPQLRHTVIASSVLMVVGSMTYFETVLLLTNGGPGNATRILPLHMYNQGFAAFQMGYASAIAVLLVVLGAGLSLIVVRVTGYSRMTSQREGM